MAMGYKLCHTLVARSPTVVASHVCLSTGFVNEYGLIDFEASSAESVGSIWLRKLSELVI
jgi:hypothetical protein